MKLFVLCLVLLSVQVFTFNIFTKDHSKKVNPNDDRVKVDFYYESLCPYCQQFMERSLKTAASTKVILLLFRTSGKSVTSTSTPMAMPEDKRMELMTGVTHVSTELENAKETSLKLVPSSSTPTISRLKFFLSLSVLKLPQAIGLSKERSALLNMD